MLGGVKGGPVDPAEGWKDGHCEMFARLGRRNKRLSRSGIKRQDHTEIERIGPEGGVEQSGAGEDSSWNGLIIIVAWRILDPDRWGSDREWNVTHVAQGACLCRDETNRNARVAGNNRDGMGGYQSGW